MGCFWYSVVITYQHLWTPVNWCQNHGLPRLIDALEEQKQARLVWSYRRATVTHITERGVRTVSSDPVYHGKYLTSMWTSKLDHIAMEEGCLDWWIAFSFRSGGWLGESVVPVWGRHGSKMHCGKKSRSAKAVLCSGQCSAERPWVLAFMRMLLWHVPPT